jgi:hypothetical protein
VTAVPGVFDVEVDDPGERADHLLRRAVRGRGRTGVDDQEAAHSPRVAAA